jgi:hypothetical protein
MAPTSAHQAQKEEVVNDELRFTYHMTLPPADSGVELLGQPTEF